jgi:uncharacterized membrane protein YccC
MVPLAHAVATPLAARWRLHGRMRSTLGAVAPPLLFGLRLWASVCLAYYLAFWLELDTAAWAGLSAAIVCQPRLGASLRKGWFRMIGTVVGAVAIVVLTAIFPQQRGAFLVCLALWGGACALVATLVANFTSYAAALAGYTAAIVAADQLGPTGGGPHGDVFMLAVTRTTEICIGIASAGLVLAGTDLGSARRRLAALLASLSSEVARPFLGAFARSGSQPADGGDPRELIRRVVAAEPAIDEAIGESIQLRSRLPVLQDALDGLLAALAAWRAIALHLAQHGDPADRRDARAILGRIPRDVRLLADAGDPTRWTADPSGLRILCEDAARALVSMPTATPSLRLVGDQTASALKGLSRALDGLALLVNDSEPSRPTRRRVWLSVSDWLTPLVNAARAFVAIGAVAAFWIATAWPNGASAITWAAVPVLLFSPRADQSYGFAAQFMMGNAVAIVFAAIVAFGVLPALSTFVAFSLALGLYLVPAGALVVRSNSSPMFNAMAFNFLAALAPANQMSYDTRAFYNTALAILLGNGAAALAFRLVLPPSPALRTRRLLRFALRELRGLAAGPIPQTNDRWEDGMHGKIRAMPDAATARDWGRLLTALSTGTAMLELRRAARELEIASEVDSAIETFAQGRSALTAARLAQVDKRLAARSVDPAPTLRARASILVIQEALTSQTSYFDSGART